MPMYIAGYFILRHANWACICILQVKLIFRLIPFPTNANLLPPQHKDTGHTERPLNCYVQVQAD